MPLGVSADLVPGSATRWQQSFPETARVRGGTGCLFIISGPSGAGKGTLVRNLLERRPGLRLSISVTTRAPRPGEKEGVDYYFFSEERFDQAVAQGEFLEWAPVYANRYGTLRAPVGEALRRGEHTILEIDVQGALQVKRALPRSILVFIKPPSTEELEARLRRRGTEDDVDRLRRLRIAVEELELARHYDYVITNDEMRVATEALCNIVEEVIRQAD